MSLFYWAVQSSIPSKDGKKKFHPRLVKVGKIVGTQKLGELIAEKSSLTPGDVHNVIRNLMSTMREQLLNSRSVRLDGLGTFTVIAKSGGNGVDKPEEVNPRQIKNLKIRFLPEGTHTPDGGTTRAMFTGVEYERWGDKSSFGLEEEEENPGGGIDPDA